MSTMKKIPENWFGDDRLTDPANFDEEREGNWVTSKDCTIANLKQKCEILGVEYVTSPRPNKKHFVNRLRAFLRLAFAIAQEDHLGGEGDPEGTDEDHGRVGRRLRARTPVDIPTRIWDDDEPLEDASSQISQADEHESVRHGNMRTDEEDDWVEEEDDEGETREEEEEEGEEVEQEHQQEEEENDYDALEPHSGVDEWIPDTAPAKIRNRKSVTAPAGGKNSKRKMGSARKTSERRTKVPKAKQGMEVEVLNNKRVQSDEIVRKKKRVRATDDQTRNLRETLPGTTTVRSDPPPAMATTNVRSDPSPAMASVNGFDLQQAGKRVSMATNFSALAQGTGALYDGTAPVHTPAGRMMFIALQPLDIPSVGDVVIIPQAGFTESFSADLLVDIVFYYYKVDSITATEINMSYLTLNLPMGTSADRIDPIDRGVILKDRRAVILVLRGPLAQEVKRAHHAGLIEDPDAGGAGTNKSHAGRKAIYDDMNDREMRVFDKSRLVERLTYSNMARRMMEADIYVDIATTDVDLDVDKLYQLLVNVKGSQWMDDRSSLFSPLDEGDHARHYRQIHNLPCVATPAVILQFLTMGATPVPGRKYEYRIHLDQFLMHPLDMDSTSKATFKNNVVMALRNFEFFMQFLCGDIYYGICDDICASLHSGMLSKTTWDCNFVRYEIETAISFVLSEVKLTRKDIFMRKFPTIDISVASGVRDLFKYAFKNVVPEMITLFTFRNDVASMRVKPYSSSTPITSGGLGHANTTIRQLQSTTSTSGKPKTTSVPVQRLQPKTSTVNLGGGGTVNVSQQIVCRIQFCHDLGMDNSTGSKFRPCNLGAMCKFKHGCVKPTSTKDKLNAITDDLVKQKSCSPSLEGAIRAAISARP